MDPVTVRLELRAITSPDLRGRWWTDRPKVMEQVLACLADTGLWLDFAYVQTEGKRSHRLQSPEALSALLRTWAGKRLRLSQGRRGRGRSSFCQVDVDVDRLAVGIGLDAATTAERRATIVQSVLDFIRCLSGIFARDTLWGPVTRLAVDNLPFPRPRPPRFDPHFEPSCVVDIIDMAFHRQSSLGRPAEVRALLAAPLPEGAAREVLGDLTVLRWVVDLVDEELVAARLSLREQWLDRHLERPIAPGYNEWGDREVLPMFLESHPQVTLYNPDQHVGYQTLYVDSMGKVDEEQLAQSLSWLNEHELPDGSPLLRLYLIAPDRDRALGLQHRAGARGISGVFYPGDDGASWYNPTPPGLWLADGGA